MTNLKHIYEPGQQVEVHVVGDQWMSGKIANIENYSVRPDINRRMTVDIIPKNIRERQREPEQ